MQKRRLEALFLLLFLPLSSETLRNQNKAYFDSIQWEELYELTLTPLPEAYAIENNRPIPYADMIDDGGILPSLPQLGLLDYQSIPEDLLQFCDTVTAAFVSQSIDASFFTTQKPFLPHLGTFMATHLPPLSHAFYGRPSFKQDGSVLIPVRLTVKQAGQGIPDTPSKDQTATEVKDKALTAIQTEAHDEKAEKRDEKDEDNDIAQVRKAALEEKADNLSEAPPLFPEDEKPLFIMFELAALKEDTVWKIAHIDLQGAAYADTAYAD